MRPISEADQTLQIAELGKIIESLLQTDDMQYWIRKEYIPGVDYGGHPIIAGALEMVTTLKSSIISAGGSFNWDQFSEMTVPELLVLLGTNQIRFHFEP